MKHIATILLMHLYMAASAQPDSLPPVPHEYAQPDLHLAAYHTDKAGELQEIAIWILGSAMIWPIADRIGGNENDRMTRDIVGVGILGYLGVNYAAARHNRKAAKYLGLQ